MRDGKAKFQLTKFLFRALCQMVLFLMVEIYRGEIRMQGKDFFKKNFIIFLTYVGTIKNNLFNCQNTFELKNCYVTFPSLDQKASI